MSDARSEASHWLGSLLLALALHALVIAAAWWWRSAPAALPVTTPAAALMVELAPMPQAPAVPDNDLPPGPPQNEQVAATANPAPRKSSVEPLPEVATAAEPIEANSQTTTADAMTQESTAAESDNSTQASAPTGHGAAPSVRAAAPSAQTGAGSDVSNAWQHALLGHLERFKRYPRQARRLRQEGVAYVRFAVDRSGQVSRWRLGRASEHASLDEEAIAVVQRANPVPPPPTEVAGDPVEVMVPIEFYIGRR